MSIVMEYEKRVMLSEEQYFTLVSYYLRQNPHYPFIKQTNYYFETDDFFLKRNHAVLRVREIAHQGSELTLKIKEDKGDKEMTDSLSYPQFISLINDNVFPNTPIKEETIRFGRSLSNYKLMTKLETTRLEIKEDDYLVVIDKNIYNGIIDYNLEIESSSRKKAEEIILDFCKRFSLEYKKDYISKSSRALQSIKNGEN